MNFELDRTIRHTKQGMGAVRRLTAAVVVNHRKDVDAKTGKDITKPLADGEMKQINDLVREAMGFSQERGDSISVANAPFTVVEKERNQPAGVEGSGNPESRQGTACKYLLIAGIIAFLYFKIIQPALKTMFPPPPKAAETAAAAGAAGHLGAAGEAGEEEENVQIDHYAVKVQKARDLAQNDAKAVANIIKEWMGANAS